MCNIILHNSLYVFRIVNIATINCKKNVLHTFCRILSFNFLSEPIPTIVLKEEEEELVVSVLDLQSVWRRRWSRWWWGCKGGGRPIENGSYVSLCASLVRVCACVMVGGGRPWCWWMMLFYSNVYVLLCWCLMQDGGGGPIIGCHCWCICNWKKSVLDRVFCMFVCIENKKSMQILKKQTKKKNYWILKERRALSVIFTWFTEFWPV